MRIREAKKEDVTQIAALHRDSFLVADTTQITKETLKMLTPEFFAKRWEARAADNKFYTLVAEQQGKIYGFVTTEKTGNTPIPDRLLLRFLYVHKDHLREKIGTKLALAIAEKLIEKGHNTAHWYAMSSDHQSNGFYSHTAVKISSTEKKWLPLGTTPETYPDGTEASLHHYEVNDIKQALKAYKTKHSSVLEKNSLFAKKATMEVKNIEDAEMNDKKMTYSNSGRLQHSSAKLANNH